MSIENVESRAKEIGLEIFKLSDEHQMSLFDKGFWSGKLMDWAMQDPKFKVEMFRFVDVLPSLTTAEQIADHIRQYFLRPDLEVPTIIRAGLGLAASGGVAAKVAAFSIQKNVESMASIFITGNNADNARGTLQKLWNSGFCFTVDILGEAALSQKEAQSYQQKYIDLIRVLSKDSQSWKENSQLDDSPSGKVPRANVSVKCSSLYSQIDSMAMRSSVDAIKENLRPVLRAGVECGVFVNLDMEQYDTHELLLTVAEEIFMEEEFKKYPHFGIVIQTYLKDAQSDIERVIKFVTKRGTPLTVRLVKGAYWDFEVIQARQRGWEVPVNVVKSATDANYEICAAKLLSAYPVINSAFGSHNVRSLAYVLSYAESLGLAKNAFEVQMLFGMAEPFKRALASLGYRVREYAPVGEMLPGMAYLVRRLLENTSNEGFLRATFVSKSAREVLLADPKSKNISTTMTTPQNNGFQNEPFQDFAKVQNREKVEQALRELRASLSFNVPTVINGQSQLSAEMNERFNPSDAQELITKSSLSSIAQAEEAIKACVGAMKTYAKKPVTERVALLRKVADLMRRDKAKFTALMVLEVGKNFREADGDVCEAIDFCDYYAELMSDLAEPRQMGALLGEDNRYLYSPRGPALVIAPWNFPLAILCGMTVGPLVAGNPVILKPAELSTAIGYEFFKLLVEAGFPNDAVHFLPGKGSVVGSHLVSHPQVHIINFTGSRAVGLEIIREAAVVREGQKHVKKVLAEMGGKNAIIVDDDADLDEAVVGCLNSAFGFQGQKCSALSRVIILEAVYDKFVGRIKEAIVSMVVGSAEKTDSRIGPVVDRVSQKKLLEVIERNKNKILVQLEISEEMKNKGNFVPPTFFEESDLSAELCQQEFFGPLVTLIKVKDFDAAIEAINGVDYALTGGIYSRSPEHIAQAREEIEVGNLYINRGITGALVYRQPFGGFKLSGVGAKAGGPDYLLQFLEPRTITENTMRRGFAPEV